MQAPRDAHNPDNGGGATVGWGAIGLCEGDQSSEVGTVAKALSIALLRAA